MNFAFRVPSWAVGATVRSATSAVTPSSGSAVTPGSGLGAAANGTLHYVTLAAGRTRLTIELPMDEIRVERRYLLRTTYMSSKSFNLPLIMGLFMHMYWPE